MAWGSVALAAAPAGDAELAREMSAVVLQTLLPQHLDAQEPQIREALGDARTQAQDQIARAMVAWMAQAGSASSDTPHRVEAALRRWTVVSAELASLVPPQARAIALRFQAEVPEGSCRPAPGLGILEDGISLAMAHGSPRDQADTLVRWLGRLAAVLPAAGDLPPEDHRYEDAVFDRALAYVEDHDDDDDGQDDPLPTSSLLLLNRIAEGKPWDDADSAIGFCALQGWWARQVQNEAPEDRERDVRLWLLSTARQAARRMLASWDAPAGGVPSGPAAADYPPIAARFNVTGRTVASVTFDERGRAVAARVVARHLHAPGVDGETVAFAHLMDAATVAGGLAATEQPTGARHARDFEFVWSLRD